MLGLGVLFIAVGFGLGQLQTAARKGGRVDLASGLVQRLVSPAAAFFGRANDGVQDFFAGMGHAPGLRARVRELEGELASAKEGAARSSQLQAQIDDLRKLQGFAALPGRQAIPARVIGLFATDNRITLDVGSKQGVRENLAVVAPAGLLAVVQTVSADRCQALLITSPLTRIIAKAQRNPPAPGMMKGETPSSLIVEFLDPLAPVENGDDVVTAGLSEFLPEGVPIGRIVRLEDNPEFGRRRAVVFPYVPLGSVRDVVVLK